MHLTHGERRAAPRVPFFGQGVVRAAGRHVPCTTVDLSATGMLLLPAASARPGLGMRVAFKVDQYLGPVELQAILTREADYRGTYGWGIRFLNVPQRIRELLQLYVEHRVLADRELAATPPRGVEDAESSHDSGFYMKVSRRRRPESDSQPRTGASADSQPGMRHSASEPSGSKLSPSVANSSTADALETTKPGVPQGGPETIAPPSGLSAPTGLGAPQDAKSGGLSSSPTRSYRDAAFRRSSGVGRYSHVGPGRVAPTDTLGRTGPPRRGAVEGMHQTGPQRAVKSSKRTGASDEKRRSNPTPLEVRELYQRALAEVDGKSSRGKKKPKQARDTATKRDRERGIKPPQKPKR
jgi:hypothetical protein